MVMRCGRPADLELFAFLPDRRDDYEARPQARHAPDVTVREGPYEGKVAGLDGRRWAPRSHARQALHDRIGPP